MDYTPHQRRVIKDMQERGPTVFQRASGGEMKAKHIVTSMGFDCDFDEADYGEGPKKYEQN